jgi:hypothetical protein
MKKRTLLIFIIVSTLILTVGCSKAPPEISDEALQGSTDIIKANPEIMDPEIVVEDDLIKFYMVPTEGEDASKERLRQIGVDYLKLLGGYVAGDELTAPTDESYGGLYDFYDVEIIFEGDRGTVIDRGTKAKGENEINWE